MALGGYSTGSGLSISALLAKYGNARVAPALGGALYREAQGILAQSQALVPVDTGALLASGYVTTPQRSSDRVTVTVGYGGVAGGMVSPATAAMYFQTGPHGHRASGERDPAIYAIYVHENLEAHHPVGSAKFLELPFNAAKRGMTARIAADMRAELSGSGAIAAAPEEVVMEADVNPAGNITALRRPRKPKG